MMKRALSKKVYLNYAFSERNLDLPGAGILNKVIKVIGKAIYSIAVVDFSSLSDWP